MKLYKPPSAFIYNNVNGADLACISRLHVLKVNPLASM